MKYVILISACLALTGCFWTPLIGLWPSIAVNTGSSVVSFLGTGKTVSDHMLSGATGEDCRIFDIFTKIDICKSKGLPKIETREEILAFQKANGIPRSGTRDDLTMTYYNRMKEVQACYDSGECVNEEEQSKISPYKRYGWFQVHDEGIWYGKYILMDRYNFRIYGNPRDASKYK